jgi:hypothetical protein
MILQFLSELPQNQRERLAFIELRLRYLGEIRRQDIVSRFGVRVAAATRDLAQYKDLAARNIVYDPKIRTYLRSEWFHPVFEMSTDRLLSWLSQGYGDSELNKQKSLLVFESTAFQCHLNQELLSVISRSIYKKRPVEIAYRSLSSGLTTREIIPFAIADTGQNWHVRAFDRRHGDFRDFVIARMADAKLLISNDVKDHETAEKDIQWNRIVEMELVPHPANVQHPDTIEAEYGMASGILHVQVRAAMAGYLMRRWSVDCTKDHSLKGAEFHLWLRNRQALYGVSNLKLAPGYSQNEVN